MKRKLNTVLVALTLIIAAASPLLLSGTTFACPSTAPSGSAASQVLSGVGETGADCNSSNVPTLLTTIVNIVSMVAGVLAVIMIVVSGLRFMSSGGDSQKVSSAKSALIYALVGLAVAALAQALVLFVLQTSNNVKATTSAQQGS